MTHFVEGRGHMPNGIIEIVSYFFYILWFLYSVSNKEKTTSDKQKSAPEQLHTSQNTIDTMTTDALHVGAEGGSVNDENAVKVECFSEFLP